MERWPIENHDVNVTNVTWSPSQNIAFTYLQIHALLYCMHTIHTHMHACIHLSFWLSGIHINSALLSGSINYVLRYT